MQASAYLGSPLELAVMGFMTVFGDWCLVLDSGIGCTCTSIFFFSRCVSYQISETDGFSTTRSFGG